MNEGLARALPRATEVPPVMAEAMRYCVLSGGKRFRPLLSLGACEAVGASARQALPVACAMELIHTYSLVHDDLPAMDNADERRGQASCHRRFGEGNAILVGDALLTLAFELLGRNGASFGSPRRKARLAQERPARPGIGQGWAGERSRGTPNALAIVRTIGQASGAVGLIGGQVMDLQAISRPTQARAQTLLQIAERKTAALITASVVAGALAGGATAAQLKLIRRYGGHIGLAFQLIDDLHDREGLAQALGREAAATQAQRLISRAVKALEPFGKRAHTLRELATWLAATSS